MLTVCAGDWKLFVNHNGPGRRFKTFDTNHDGTLTEEEFVKAGKS